VDRRATSRRDTPWAVVGSARKKPLADGVAELAEHGHLRRALDALGDGVEAANGTARYTPKVH
jgi:hypothetical protein